MDQLVEEAASFFQRIEAIQKRGEDLRAAQQLVDHDLDQIEEEFVEFQKRMEEKIEIVRNIF
jgi:predicted  nucleic acid-binding Zn-ribbon protein